MVRNQLVAWAVPAVLTVCTLSLCGPVVAQKGGEKPPVIKDVMKRAHTKDGPLNKLGQAIKGARWDDAAALAKDLVQAGDDLSKSTPPKKGSAASWKKLTKQYQDDTTAVAAAVEKKNAGNAKEALETLNASCRTCHTVHK